MEWWVVLIILIGLLMGFFLTGLPVAFSFLLLNLIGLTLWVGGLGKLFLIIESAYFSIASFTLIAAPLFILMGEIMFRTGLARYMIDNIGKWVGGTTGSLSLLAVAAGTAFSTMSGSAMSSVAVLGSALVPEMRARGYSKEMSIGPILGSGGLAMIIPPTVMGIILASLARVSISKYLIAAIIPGFVLAGLYTIYILVRGRLQPHLAPAFSPPDVTWAERIKALIVISPLSIIIFLVVGLIFLGVATPSEAAATGVAGTFVLAALYRKLTWQSIKDSLAGSVRITSMVFLIIMGSITFSQILAFTGGATALVNLAVGLPTHPMLVVIAMQFLLILMGMFIEQISIVMITVPIFFTVIRALGLDPLWFSIVMIVNIEMASISPPFGLSLFTMKGVVPDATMGDIYRAAIPFFLLGLALIIALLIFPDIATFLPNLMIK